MPLSSRWRVNPRDYSKEVRPPTSRKEKIRFFSPNYRVIIDRRTSAWLKHSWFNMKVPSPAICIRGRYRKGCIDCSVSLYINEYSERRKNHVDMLVAQIVIDDKIWMKQQNPERSVQSNQWHNGVFCCYIKFKPEGQHWRHWLTKWICKRVNVSAFQLILKHV